MRRPLSRPTTPAVGSRKSEPIGSNSMLPGGLGVIARRGFLRDCDPANPLSLSTSAGVRAKSAAQPLRLLKDLIYVHPTLDDALWNAIVLAIAPGDVRITAVIDNGNGEEPDEEGTKALDALWASLPNDIGGFDGLLGQLFQESLLTGLVCLEAVPGKRGVGVSEACPVDSLSIVFKRVKDANGKTIVVAQQRQTAPSSAVSRDGFVDMPTESFFWCAVNPLIDDPYGRAPYAPAANEVLADIALYRDVRNAVHMAGNARYAQAFAFQETIEYATKSEEEGGLGMSLEDADAYVLKQFQFAQDVAGTLKTDDVWLYDKAGEVKVLDGAKGMAALEKILIVLRQRLTQAVKTPGTIFGISDGATDTFSTKELEIYATGLETIRGVALMPMALAAGLHLRLLGRGSKPKIVAKRIRATDALAAANTLTVEINNERALVAWGLKSGEDASMALTGSAPYDPERADNPPAASVSTPSPPVPDNAPAQPVKFGRAGQPAEVTK